MIGTDQGMTAEDREAASKIERASWLSNDHPSVLIVRDHRLSSTAALEAEVRNLKQRLESAVTQLTRARRIIADIDDYMDRPGRGDWGEECACCMGELLDDDRPTLIVIDTFLQEQEKQNG